MNKYQVNPNKDKVIKAARHTKGKQLYLITNDFDGAVDIKRNVSDIKLNEFLKDPDSYASIKLLRLGIEAIREENRKKLGKVILNSQLRELFYIAKKIKKRVNLFFIVGIESTETWKGFASLLPQNYDGKPKIGIVMNYFAPQALTPLASYDLRTYKK